MKTTLFSAAFIFAFFSCAKNTSAPISNSTNSFNVEGPGSNQVVLAWKCIGGDTLFNDTLFMSLSSVWFEHKVEMHKYTFSYPVWYRNEWVCTATDAIVIKNMSFSNEECKTVYFKRVK